MKYCIPYAFEKTKIFEKFARIDNPLTRTVQGNGLGLYITKSLVEMMDGSIDIQSEVGQGTMFTFSIWVDLPEDEQTDVTTVDRNAVLSGMMQQNEADAQLKEFGTEENKAELEKNLSKLILCVEMDNWEKAETFMVAVKQLTDTAPQEIRTCALRLKMAVQKADYEKTSIAYEGLIKLL